MENKEIYVYGKQEGSKSESRRPPPYDVSAAHEALPNALDEAKVCHAIGRTVVVEKKHRKGIEMYMLHQGVGRNIQQEGNSS